MTDTPERDDLDERGPAAAEPSELTAPRDESEARAETDEEPAAAALEPALARGRDEGAAPARADEAGRAEAAAEQADEAEAAADEAAAAADEEAAAADEAAADEEAADAGRAEAAAERADEAMADEAARAEVRRAAPARSDDDEDDEDDDDDDLPHLARFIDELDESGALEASRAASSNEEPEIPLHLIDPDALWVVRRLRAKGHEAYLTGGCVRDLLLGRQPKDFDVATAAHPDQVKGVFRNCRLIGRRFRLAHIYFPSGKVIETATFRANPLDMLEDLPDDLLVERDNVFGTVEEDARRRDLTINGLFYDPLAGKVLDFVDGRRDLELKLIRTIGDPDIRFQEDPVRILRAIKFATRLGFDFEPDTLRAMQQHVEGLARCAAPRLLEELHRLLVSGHAKHSFELCKEVGVLRVLLPELLESLDAEIVVPVQAVPRLDDEDEPSDEESAEVEPSGSAEAAEGIEAIESAETSRAVAPEGEVPAEEAAAEEASGDEAGVDAASGDEAGSEEPGAADDAASDALPNGVSAAHPAVRALISPEQRWHRFGRLLESLDAVRERKAEVSSAVTFTALLLPGYEAHVAAGNDAVAWLDDVTARWTERIRLTRHDRETSRYLFKGLEQLRPENRRGSAARHLVGRPWFREALLLYTLSLHAAGESLAEVGRWKVVAAHYQQPYKQLRQGERAPKPRRARRSRRGGNDSGGGRRGGRRRS